ncbi:MAG: phosphoenolpyruvate--protein phosphotransferase [Mariprofundaceae bacterium]
MSPSATLYGNAIAGSGGILMGRIQKLTHGRHPIPERSLKKREVNGEVRRLQRAVEMVLVDMNQEHNDLAKLNSKDPLLILEAHRLLLSDPELTGNAERIIREKCINAEWALRQQMDIVEAVFDSIEDPYLRDKKVDVEQAGERILRQLMQQTMQLDTSTGLGPQILIGADFSPSDVVAMWRIGVAGFIAEQGGMNAHSIIVARGVGMPALIGADDLMDKAEDGDCVILDAELRKWILNPSESEKQHYQQFVVAMQAARSSLQSFASKPSLSRNGRELKIMGNLEFKEELELAHEVGAEGVGLYRTEFMFINAQSMPDEDTQYQYYADIVHGMAGRPVTFRLLDIGGDKPALFQQLSGQFYGGENPAMGMRGVRLLLQWPEILKIQLSALLRASEDGPVNILIPMISTAEEIERIRDITELCKRELGISKHIDIGAMIEVPGAVLIADQLAEVSDFFSIGTNDLIQYTLAADRNDEDVCRIYQADHPAIKQLIHHTVKAAKEAQIPIAICGELAADPEWTQAFLDMGVSELSMSLNNILMIRRHLSKLSYQAI